MEEERYLKWYNKVGCGSGDIAGIVGKLMIVSKLLIKYKTYSLAL